MQHIRAENRVNRPVTHNPSINKSIYIEGEFAKNLGVVFLQMANFPPGESAKEHVHQTMHEFFHGNREQKRPSKFYDFQEKTFCP